jgi:hypothetical protein
MTMSKYYYEFERINDYCYPDSYVLRITTPITPEEQKEFRVKIRLSRTAKGK